MTATAILNIRIGRFAVGRRLLLLDQFDSGACRGALGISTKRLEYWKMQCHPSPKREMLPAALKRRNCLRKENGKVRSVYRIGRRNGSPGIRKPLGTLPFSLRKQFLL